MSNAFDITAKLSFEVRCREAKESLLNHWRSFQAGARPKEDFLQTLWKWRLHFTRELYGSDATDFALKAIGNDRGGNE